MKNKKLGVLLNYLILFISNAMGIVMTPIMIGFVGQQQYGLYSLIGSFVGYLTVLDFGLSNTIIRYVAKYKEENDTESEENFIALSLLIYIVIAVTIMLVGSLLYSNLENVFISLSTQEIFQAKQMFIILIINVAFTLPGQSFNGILLAYEEFVYPKLINILKLVFRFLLFIITLKLGYGIVALVLVDTILNFILTMFNIIYVLFKMKVSIKLREVKVAFLLEIFSFSFFIFLNMIIDQIYWRLDQTILGIMIGTNAVSLYAIAMIIVNGYISLSTGISSVYYSQMTRMVVSKASEDELNNLILKVGRIQLILLGFFLTGFLVLGEYFINLWLGYDYLIVYTIVALIIVPFTVPLIQNMAGTLVQIKNLHSKITIIYIIIAVINVFVSIILVKMFGLIGCALGTMGSTIIGNIIIVNIFYKKAIHLNIRQFYTNLLKNIIPVLTIIVLSGRIIVHHFYDLNEITWLTFILMGILFSLFYGFIMFIFGTNNKEKEMIRGLFSQLKF